MHILIVIQYLYVKINHSILYFYVKHLIKTNRKKLFTYILINVVGPPLAAITANI